VGVVSHSLHCYRTGGANQQRANRRDIPADQRSHSCALRGFSRASTSRLRHWQWRLTRHTGFDVQELSREVRVSQTGTIGIPLVPVRLHVAGLTEIQTQRKIAEVLESNGLVSHPDVSVTVKDAKANLLP